MCNAVSSIGPSVHKPALFDAIAVTLGTGPKYAALASNLLRRFAAAGNPVLVVTDMPDAFDAGTITIPYEPDGTHIWHAKRHAIAAGLERAWTAYFVDADFVPYTDCTAYPVPKLERMPMGVGGCAFKFRLEDVNFVGSIGHLADDPERVAVLEAASEHFKLNWKDLFWWGDFLFYVSRDEGDAGQRFVRAWHEFAQIRNNRFVASDGTAMAFAQAASGMPLIHHPPSLRAINGSCWHSFAGDHNRKNWPKQLPTTG